MNVLEGARRMQVVGKTINLTTAGFMLLGFVVSLILNATGTAAMLPPALSGMMLIIAGVWPLLLGGILWIAGWILEGFATPRPTQSPSSLRQG